MFPPIVMGHRVTICGLRWALEPSPLHERDEGNLGVKAPTTTLLGPKRLWIIIVNIIIIIIVVVVVVVVAVVIITVVTCFPPLLFVYSSLRGRE